MANRVEDRIIASGAKVSQVEGDESRHYISLDELHTLSSLNFPL